MGWTFGNWKKKSEVVSEILSGFGYGEEVLDSSIVGNSLWVAYKKENRAPSIYLFMLDKEDGEWGYKDIHEDMGPFDYSCPKNLLKLCGDDSARSPSSKEWRAKIMAK